MRLKKAIFHQAVTDFWRRRSSLPSSESLASCLLIKQLLYVWGVLFITSLRRGLATLKSSNSAQPRCWKSHPQPLKLLGESALKHSRLGPKLHYVSTEVRDPLQTNNRSTRYVQTNSKCHRMLRFHTSNIFPFSVILPLIQNIIFCHLLLIQHSSSIFSYEIHSKLSKPSKMFCSWTSTILLRQFSRL